jgi:hypothetical protein
MSNLEFPAIIDYKNDENYIKILNTYIKDSIKNDGSCSLKKLIEIAQLNFPELKGFCDTNQDKLTITSVKDKGLTGKIVEFSLFGNLPNSFSSPDMIYGDIKTTHFKRIGKNGVKTFNAKERLTLTNFGDPDLQTNIDKIADKNSFQETRYYAKVKSGIILIFEHESTRFDTIESYYEKKIMGIVFYNLDDIFQKNPDIEEVFQTDFIKIKTCIIEKNVSQAGQQYLHIHPHGCKNGKTRAFGFTNKFLTKMVSIYLNLPLITKGRSEYIEF